MVDKIEGEELLEVLNLGDEWRTLYANDAKLGILKTRMAIRTSFKSKPLAMLSRSHSNHTTSSTQLFPSPQNSSRLKVSCSSFSLAPQVPGLHLPAFLPDLRQSQLQFLHVAVV